MKHILVTTDFSDEAEVAYAYAKEQAQLIGKGESKITLLKVIDIVIPTSDDLEYGVASSERKGILDKIYNQASERIKKIAQEQFSDFSIEASVIKPSKDVSQGIIEYAETHNVNLIVMSTHGRTGMGRLLLGSVAERVIRQSPCPVMVIPASITKK